MPYFISKSAQGWDTVKEDGTVLGSHADKKKAIAQMVALSIAEKMTPGGELKRAVEAGSYSPPAGVAEAASRALKWIAEGYAGNGFTAVGRARAVQLASGKNVSADVVNRMISYFARHEVDKQATGFSSGEDGFPSAGRVAWDAWGGDAGQNWVNGMDNKMAKRDVIAQVGITDLDDTLIVNGALHQDYFDWLDHQGVKLYVVTGRDETQRADTIDQLDEFGVQYRELIMRPSEIPAAGTNDWKGSVAAELIANGEDVRFAVDNDPQARAAYKKAGVMEVLDPKTIDYKTQTRDGYMDEVEPVAEEAVEPTKEYLAEELCSLMSNLVSAKFLAHGAHWNVKGVLFSQYHKFFQKIYEDYELAIDQTAENIRKLDVDAKFMLPEFVAETEIEATFIGGDPVQLSLAVYKANEILLKEIVTTLDCADDLNQQGIYNFLADLQDRFGVWHWQLGAVIGDDLRNAYATDIEEVDEIHDPAQPTDEMPASDMLPDMTMGDMQMDSVRFIDPTQVAVLAKRGERVTKGIERRQIVRDLEIRAEGDGMTLRGYAAIFNSPSQPLPFTETIAQGAFRDSLNSRNDVKLLWNHDTGTVLGSTRAGTLKLSEDAKGLLVEAMLPDTQAGRDAATLIKRGDVNAFSFGFRVPMNGDEWPSADQRILKRVNVHEVSLVAFPAYTATEGTASVRAMTELADKIARLAEIRGVSAEELTDALLALESGDELTERQGELLTDTLGKVLKQDPEVTNPAALLDLKKKELDLLMKRV
jgi:HK97 family phage prohead protease